MDQSDAFKATNAIPADAITIEFLWLISIQMLARPSGRPKARDLGRAAPGETRDKFNMTLARRQSKGGQHADATALRVDARPSFSLHRVHVRHQRSDHRRAKLKMGHLHPFMAENDTFGERFL